MRKFVPILALGLMVVLAAVPRITLCEVASDEAKVTVQWDDVIRVSRTSATLQVVPHPEHRRDSPIHDQIWGALQALHLDYARYSPWYPLPKLSVAELEPPANGKTSWDFSLIDPITLDFLHATAGHPVIVNFGTIPQWMFKTPERIPYPSDPNEMTIAYGRQGTELRDPSMKEVADYFTRVMSWYTNGGFKDEYDNWHASNYHFNITYWEILNEVTAEHAFTPERYAALYDAVVEAVRKVAPQTKFVGLALSNPQGSPQWFEYFLNPSHHKPGIPLDMISYHFYAQSEATEDLDACQYDYFAQADHFLDTVRYIEVIRERFSRQTRTTVDEIGAFLPNLNKQPPPDAAWNLSAALYAYLYGNLTRLGIDAAGESTLRASATQVPYVSMLDPETAAPNARYLVLKMLSSKFHPGDKLLRTQIDLHYIFAQAFEAADGSRKVLLVNKRNRPFRISLKGAGGGTLSMVDEATGSQPPVQTSLAGDEFTLPAFAVAVVNPSR